MLVLKKQFIGSTIHLGTGDDYKTIELTDGMSQSKLKEIQKIDGTIVDVEEKGTAPQADPETEDATSIED